MKSFKKKGITLCCDCMIILFLVAGGILPKTSEVKKELKTQVLYLNLGSEPATLDPAFYGGALTQGLEGGHIINNTFEGLMREINGKLVTGMAEKYSISEDGLTYKFTLRSANWSDGVPVKAKDFEYAWKRALDPTLASDYANLLYCLKGGEEYNVGKGSVKDVGVKAVDDKTLQVTLTSPRSHFLQLTTLHNFMPIRKDKVEIDPKDWAKTPSIAICNGPFKLTEYSVNNEIILTKNPNYWNVKNTKIDKVIATMITDEPTAINAYRENKLDIVDVTNYKEIPDLKKEFSTLKMLPEHMTYYYTFNTTKAPTNNIKVRKALSLVIDRETIVEKYGKPGQFPASGLVPLGFKDSQGNEFRKIAGDYGFINDVNRINNAKKLLADAGYPDGKGFPHIEITYNNKPEHESIAKAIQEMWKQNLGIEVGIKGVENSAFQDGLKKGDFTVAKQGWGADYGDPMTFLDLWTTKNTGDNSANWINDKYDKIMESAYRATGDERDKLLYQAEKMLMDEMVIAPIYHLSDPVLVKDCLKNWNKTTLAYWWLGNAYLEN